ncbi:hypothetical protein AB9F29_09390 [Falsihalocynthiibacter sp. S25ZX9]|uniref:hypothetical protein n=1 Tax=Falsihalocynthiibacter sp. S25ZX9 TaxID=3240870 RepID=UPI00350F84C1
MNTFLPPEHATRACAPRMPGLAPLRFADRFQISEVYGPQMALRRELLDLVLAQLAVARAAPLATLAQSEAFEQRKRAPEDAL